jgi:DNA-directed RNA polymerase specialized sigma24 family protein
MELLEDTKVASGLQAMLEKVYEPGFYEVARFIARRGGTFSQARDVYHDALVILHEQLVKGKQIDSMIAYLVGVSRHLWAAQTKDSMAIDDIGVLEDVSGLSEPTVNQRRLLTFLKASGQRCLELLSAFYFQGQKISSIVRAFGFASEHSASVQKYKCIEKIRESIKAKAAAYEDFFE